jgi:hypothetical protein
VFAYTGAAQTWTVPLAVTSATFDVFGAQGGDNHNGTAAGGKGAEVNASVPVTSGQTLQIVVGGAGAPTFGSCSGGFNGGGLPAQCGSAAQAGSGGGASDVRQGGTSLANRVVVAGGGGGAGGDGWASFGTPTNGVGGAGGDSGSAGTTAATNGTATGGGGGHAGVPDGNGGGGTAGSKADCNVNPTAGGNGSLGQGGGGGNGACTGAFGGGGGGGYNGGGGGGGASFDQSAGVANQKTAGGGGGGGGSSFGPSGASFQNGVRAGNGLVTIAYTEPTSSDLLSALADAVADLAPGSGLQKLVKQIQGYVDDNKTKKACKALKGAFPSRVKGMVQVGKLSSSEAAELNQLAQAVRNSLDC